MLSRYYKSKIAAAYKETPEPTESVFGAVMNDAAFVTAKEKLKTVRGDQSAADLVLFASSFADLLSVLEQAPQPDAKPNPTIDVASQPKEKVPQEKYNVVDLSGLSLDDFNKKIADGAWFIVRTCVCIVCYVVHEL